MRKYSKRAPRRKGRSDAPFTPMTAEALRAWRKERGMARPALARQLGISLSTLIRLESGEGPIEKLYRLALAAVAAGMTDYGASSDGGPSGFVTLWEQAEEEDDGG